jgi:hypothetical protein
LFCDPRTEAADWGAKDGAPSLNTTALAWVGQAQWLLVIWAFWIDRHRAVDNAVAKTDKAQELKRL